MSGHYSEPASSEVYLGSTPLFNEPTFERGNPRGVMNIDPGLAVVILAVLIFYLRLIIIQRQRIKRMSQTPAIMNKKKKGADQPQVTRPDYSILSKNRRDQAIGMAGVLAILVGVLLNAKLIPWPVAQPYWWIPTAIGIVAFSWGFKL
jgi:hypothetical protein